MLPEQGCQKPDSSVWCRSSTVSQGTSAGSLPIRLVCPSAAVIGFRQVLAVQLCLPALFFRKLRQMLLSFQLNLLGDPVVQLAVDSRSLVSNVLVHRIESPVDDVCPCDANGGVAVVRERTTHIKLCHRL